MSCGHPFNAGKEVPTDRQQEGFPLIFFLVCLGFEAWDFWLVVVANHRSATLRRNRGVRTEEATLSAQEDTMAKSS